MATPSKGNAAAGIAPASTDANTAALFSDPNSLSRLQLVATIADTTGRNSDAAYRTLQAAVDATRAGDTLEIQKSWTLSAPVNIGKSMTIRCVRGGKVSTTGDVHAFNVVASDVAFDNAILAGSGSALYGSQAGIRVVGTAQSPITRLIVRGCTISGFRRYGVQGEHVHDFNIDRNRIESIGYAGIMLTSPKDGDICNNTVRNITKPAGFLDAYGIAVSRNSLQSLTSAPQASGILIYRNRVEGVTAWEGIDAHGGENILIAENTIRNCRYGISLVPSGNAAGVDTYAPKRIKVLDNTIIAGASNGSRAIGIQLVGCITDAGGIIDYADAVIKGNTVDGHGSASSVNTGAILLQATIGTVVTGNVLTESVLNAIHATIRNKNLNVHDNIATDTWSDNQPYTSVLRVSSNYNTIKATGNVAVRANRKAALVNNRGLFISPVLVGTTVLWENNEMTDTTLGIIDGGFSYSRLSATKMAFSAGATPVTRPALPGAATDDATALTLINKIRSALIAYGLGS